MMYVWVWQACIHSDTSTTNLNFIPHDHISSSEDNNMFDVGLFLGWALYNTTKIVSIMPGSK